VHPRPPQRAGQLVPGRPVPSPLVPSPATAHRTSIPGPAAHRRHRAELPVPTLVPGAGPGFVRHGRFEGDLRGTKVPTGGREAHPEWFPAGNRSWLPGRGPGRCSSDVQTGDGESGADVTETRRDTGPGP